MTGPAVTPDPRILANLQRLKDAGAPDDVLEQYLNEVHAPPLNAAPQSHDYHAEFKSGALQKRMAGANARDVANANEEDAAQPSTLDQKLTNALSVGSGVLPGMEALEAGAGSVGSQLTSHPMGYRESLQTLRGNTDQIGHKAQLVQKILGGAATGLVKAPVSIGARTAGAVIGGADQALNADPDESLMGRAGRTVVGAGIGGLMGGAAESGSTMLRALLSKTPAANIMTRTAERQAASSPLFKQAIREGVGNTNTPQIAKSLAEPDVAEIVKGLLETRQFRGLAPNDPKVLDAAVHVMTDQERQIARGLAAPNPSKPNIGRYTKADITTGKTDLIDAMAGGATVPGPMPSYRGAMKEYAQHSAGIGGVKRGSGALKNTLSKSIPAGNNIVAKSDEQFANEAANAAPEVQQAMSQGILGEVKEQPKLHFQRVFGVPIVPTASEAVKVAPRLLRMTGTPQQEAIDRLIQAGLLSAGATTQ